MSNIQFAITEQCTVPCAFIYNDFRLTHPSANSFFLEVKTDEQLYSICCRREGAVIHMGLWLCELPQELLAQCCRYLFSRHADAAYIKFENAPIGPDGTLLRTDLQRNHWMIAFPSTSEELDQRLSAKTRSNIKRKKRLAMELSGGYQILQYTADTVPESVVETFFVWKQNQFGTDYHANPKEYLSQYHVSHVYVLQLDGKIGAIVITCEQTPFVYLENLAYDPQYSSYSLGAILYDHVLRILIEKGKHGIYLGYGNHRYKSMYGALEQTVYTSTVYRSRLRFFREVCIPRYYRAARAFAGRMLRKLRSVRKV